VAAMSQVGQLRTAASVGFEVDASCALPSPAITQEDSIVTQAEDLAIPTLPSRSISITTNFYRQLGFEGDAHEFNPEYAIFTRGAIELHFFTHKELVPGHSSAGCYIRVRDVQGIYEAFSASSQPHAGLPRMNILEDKPWGLREFAVVDPDGNLLRIGQVIRG
jgi:catechol 2,3-dioxygenase-like lactoylglutathione lyase family enzyme